MLPREFELCAETLQACAAASDGGADRIELCAALGEGGVTPSLGLLREAIAAVHIPVHVLVRPRTGDFVYSPAEFRALCRDVDDALAAGAVGVVTGLITQERIVNRERMRQIVALSQGRPVTFHRAFDQLRDLSLGLETLIDLGCQRVLTSGGRPTVTEGLTWLRTLAAQARGRIRVVAGGGVTLANAPGLLAVEGLDLHASLRRKAAGVSQVVADPLWGPAEDEISVADVRAMHRIVHGTPAV